MQARHNYVLNMFEKLGTPLLAAVTESTERERLQAMSEGQQGPDDMAEAERIAGLLKASAEMGITLSRQLDLRMAEPSEADGVRLALAAISAPLVANLFRVNGRAPATAEIDRISSALQAVTLFADNYNAAADATMRLTQLDQDFAPADGVQVQLNIVQALMPAINAVCTFSFGQPEKLLIQDVIDRLFEAVRNLRADLFGDLPERDALRAEIMLLRSAALIYSQTHFTEMSKLMFLDDSARDAIDLNKQRAEMWAQVEQRLVMLRVIADTVVGQRGRPGSEGSAGVSADPAAMTRPLASVAATPSSQKTVQQVPDPSSGASASASGGPMSFFARPVQADSTIEGDV